MLVRWGLPFLSLCGAVFATLTVVEARKPKPAEPPVQEPPTAGQLDADAVAGVGLIEPRSESIAIGTPVGALVTRVQVEVGQLVRVGEPLFQLDDRIVSVEVQQRHADLAAAKARLAKLLAQPRSEELPPSEAAVTAAEAEVAAAVARLAKLEAQPRPEDIPPAEARLAAAEAELADARDRLRLWRGVADSRAVSRDELNRREFACQTLEARVAEARANLGLLKAGAWKPDVLIAQAEIAAAQARRAQRQRDLELRQAGAWMPDLEVARAEVAVAEARLRLAETDLARLTVRAPRDGQVLRVNVRAGEYATPGGSTEPTAALMVLGDTSILHVRIEVDENDIPRLRAGRPAVASPRGNSQRRIPLQFVRVEPFVVPKKNLTGAAAERVDTRVVQVIYRLPAGEPGLFVGQQMDVFISAK